MVKPELDDVRRVLSALAGSEVEVSESHDRIADGVVRIGTNRFVLEIKGSARGQTIAQAMMQLDRIANNPKWADHRPLIFVDRMGQTGRSLCKQYNLNWADLAGNADIQGNGLLLRISGQRAQAPPEVHPAFNPFSRSASRVAHILLLHPHEALTQRDIAIQAVQSKGAVSRAVSALQSLGFIETIAEYKKTHVRVTNWERLLDSWLETYRSPRLYAGGLVTAHDGFDAMRQVAEELRKHEVRYIFSGLAAAAHYTKFGSFRRVLVYVDSLPLEARERFNVSEDMRGRNILFARDDKNATLGVNRLGPYCFASPYMTLMDLAHEPERAEEATETMRRMIRDTWR